MAECGTRGPSSTVAATGLALRTDVPAFFPPGTTAGIIGVATTPGSYSFTLQATSGGQSVTQAATMKISGLLLMEIEFPTRLPGFRSRPCN